ncbi:MAG: hypothetical protein WCD11_13210 [Solirubrobacteraceae bacterium]
MSRPPLAVRSSGRDDLTGPADHRLRRCSSGLALIEADPLASLVLLAVVVAGPRPRAAAARRDRWRRQTAVVLGDAVVALALDSSPNAGAPAHA